MPAPIKVQFTSMSILKNVSISMGKNILKVAIVSSIPVMKMIQVRTTCFNCRNVVIIMISAKTIQVKKEPMVW